MSCAVVILNWNGAKMLRRYLPSVLKNSDDAEIIVADNASTDNSVELLKQEFPTVRIILLDRNYGFAEGYNRALAQVKTDYYVLLNSDVEVPEHWLQPLIEYMDAHPDTAVCQPKLLKAENGGQETFEYAGAAGGFVDCYGYPFCRGRVFSVVEDDCGQYDEPMEIHWATGACMLIRREDWQAAGGLDGRFFAHNEEIDLCWRLRIMGRKIMCITASKAYHLGGGTLPQGNPRKTYLNFRNNLTMLYKNLPDENLSNVMRWRYWLDRIAMLQSLLKGNIADVKAIMKARRDYKAWKKDFSIDREKIQNNRRLNPQEDLYPHSVLWQFFAKRHKKWSSLPRVLVLMFIISTFPFNMNADDKTRGIGIYPGRTTECTAPTLVQDNEYRNIALHRMAYSSSNYDFNLTPQLLTDGIKTKKEPAWLETLVNGKTLPAREREWVIDGNEWTNVVLDGATADLVLRWHNMTICPDSIQIIGTAAYDEEKATRGYDISLRADGIFLDRKAQNGMPGKRTRYDISSDPNKQTGVSKLPGMDLQLSFGGDWKPFSELHLHMNMPGVAYWKITQIKFFRQGKEYTEVQPSFSFGSAWKPLPQKEQWAYVDLGAQATFDKVLVHWVNDAVPFTVLTSDDALTWTKFENTASARYVRILFDATDKTLVSEIEVFGRGGLTAQPTGWTLQRSSEVNADGAKISATTFDDSHWLTATVPATVLMSYVNAGTLQNPNYDDDMFLASESFFNSNFWYRHTFNITKVEAGKHIILNLDGINWKANVWVNGDKVGRVEGAFIRGRFDITKFVKAGDNALAIEIERVAHPGSVKEKNEVNTDFNGGILGYDNPTFHATVGWDWISTIRGRDIGIWNDVRITTENAITLRDPFVDTHLNLPDTLATLTPQVVLQNNTDKEIKGLLRAWVGDIAVEKSVTIGKGSVTESFCAAEFAELRNRQMRLWWPNGYGEPYLYDAGFAFVDAQGNELSRIDFKQGIRQTDYESVDTDLLIKVNGRRVVPFGGNWGFSEHNLNYRGREYDIAVRYHRDMNFNMIRNWVGQTGDDEFYEACDRYGIMVWQDFWLANPADGPDPKDEAMFMRNADDMVSRIRQHASVVLYCGRNEGYPPATLDSALRLLCKEKHPGIVYISSSADDGVSGHGPYWAVPAKEYFERQTGKLHSERGMPNVMTFDGLSRTLRQEHLWPQSNFWGQHDYTMEGAQRGATFNQMIAAYGNAQSAQQFCANAQWINYNGYRAMYESGSRDRRGLLIWMSHACWPSMTWQCYDYYFEPTAAFFGCKKACEPLHVQYNALTSQVEVVNYGAGKKTGLEAKADIYALDGKLINSISASGIDSDFDSTLPCFDVTLDEEDGYLMRLTLSQNDVVLSQNDYLSPSKSKEFNAASVTAVSIDTIDSTTLKVTIAAPEDQPLYLVRLNLTDGEGTQILPVDYSDNYFHILPGESKEVTIRWNSEDQHAEGVKVTLSTFALNK